MVLLRQNAFRHFDVENNGIFVGFFYSLTYTQL